MITQTISRPATMSLYSIQQELSDALAAVEVDYETGELVGMDKVDALQVDMHDKIVNVGRYVQNQAALLAAMKDAKKALEERIKATDKRIAGMKRMMIEGMQQLNAKKVEEGDIAISLRSSASVEIYDESLLAADYLTEKITYTPSKTAIKKAIEAGADVQGARIVQGFSVQIK